MVLFIKNYIAIVERTQLAIFQGYKHWKLKRIFKLLRGLYPIGKLLAREFCPHNFLKNIRFKTIYIQKKPLIL